jgi:hypothetical protein
MGMILTLLALAWLHGHLDQLLNVELRELINPRAFRSGHRWYLWLSTVQWIFGGAYAVLALYAWRAEDRDGTPTPSMNEASSVPDLTEHTSPSKTA